ncbi:MAG: hypothetical protein LBI71_12135 [Enterobacteriaceae bacterium]|nr:hypothetical protein [Enterobacteriaceae bacterium]
MFIGKSGHFSVIWFSCGRYWWCDKRHVANLCFLLGKIRQLAVLHNEAFALFSSDYLWPVLLLTGLSILFLFVGLA